MSEPRTGLLQVSEGSIFWKYEVAKSASSRRPTLLFIHAGVTDHTLWDDQVAYLTSGGWDCLRFDLFGFSQSMPSKEFLASDPRPLVDRSKHIELLIEEVIPTGTKIVAIGLSAGGAMALDFALAYPQLASGLAVVAGGIRGFDVPNTAEEDALFAQQDALSKNMDFQSVAKLDVRIWGDGPFQEPGRLSQAVSEKLYNWCLDIAAKDCTKTGGLALDDVSPDPITIKRVSEVRVPTAVAYGTYDESNTTSAMKYLGSAIPDADVREFRTAHMVNLERPDEFNLWLTSWLEKHYLD